MLHAIRALAVVPGHRRCDRQRRGCRAGRAGRRRSTSGSTPRPTRCRGVDRPSVAGCTTIGDIASRTCGSGWKCWTRREVCWRRVMAGSTATCPGAAAPISSSPCPVAGKAAGHRPHLRPPRDGRAVTSGAPAGPPYPPRFAPRETRGAPRVCSQIWGPERAPHTPHASRPGKPVALRECAVRYGAPSAAPHTPHASRPGKPVALRECAVRYGAPSGPPIPPTLRAPGNPWRSASVQSDMGPRAGPPPPTLRAPGNPWRSASVQSGMGPRAGPPYPPRFAPRETRGAPRVCSQIWGPERAPHTPHASRPGKPVALRECAVRYGAPSGPPIAPHASRPGKPVALRECAVRYGAPSGPPIPPTLRAPGNPWRSASVQSDMGPRAGPPYPPRFAPRETRGAPRVCSQIRGPERAPRSAVRGPAIPPTLRAPAEPWRFAGVRSDTRPRDAPEKRPTYDSPQAIALKRAGASRRRWR